MNEINIHTKNQPKCIFLKKKIHKKKCNQIKLPKSINVWRTTD